MKSKFLIADTAAFIKNVPLHDLTDQVVTCKEVIAEIKDKATRERFAFLPYKIKYQSPAPKYMNKVAMVAKKTGDYRNLSTTDLKVVALCYQLQCEHDCDSMPGDEVPKNVIQVGADKSAKFEDDLPGFYTPSHKKKNIKSLVTEKVTKDPEETDTASEGELDEEDKTDFKKLKEKEDKLQGERNYAKILHKMEILKMWGDAREEKEKKEVAEKEAAEEEAAEEEAAEEVAEEEAAEYDEENSNDSEEEGWITPASFAKIQEKASAEAKLAVAKAVVCLTTDFAMQNVMLKMKLNIVAVDGMIIKSVRSYILRCYSCNTTTSDMNKKFCPKCGHDTLKRVSVQTQEDGTLKMFFSKRPNVLNKRGKKYSLPTPKGGKHSNNPLLAEDQRVPHQRPSKKSSQKNDVWSEDYDTNASPFANTDVYSRAFRVGVRANTGRGGGRHNPNAVGKRTGKRR